jgi:hypothetical protein
VTRSSTIPGWIWALVAIGIGLAVLMVIFFMAVSIGAVVLMEDEPETAVAPVPQAAPPSVPDVVEEPPVAVVAPPSTVRVESEPPGAEVRRDGADAVVCTTPCEIPSDGAADIHLAFRAPGYVPSELVVRPGSTVRVTLTPEAPAVQMEEAAPRRRRERPTGTATEPHRDDPYAF